jgi:hypothetical protein
VLVGYCLMLLCVAVAVLCVAAAPKAEAAYYKMVLCAGNNGSNGYQTATNTASAQNPGGIFSFENHCGPAPFPAGNNAFLRIAENQSGGNAGYGAYGSISWSVPPWVDLLAGGGYTREPNAFNDGWRGRFWLEGWDGSTNNALMQGSGVQNGSCDGVCWATTSTFASHLWPFGGYGKYRRFVFELTCFRQAGCDRTNFNAVDANTMILTLNDAGPSQINLTNTGSGMLAGQWVRGSQDVKWNVQDLGSGMRFERLRVDGGERHSIDWRANCNLDANGSSGEFARDFQPCPVGGPWGRTYALDTASLPDGAHSVQVCSQDYGQAAGISGTGGESCDQRQVRTDNNPPPAPGGLAIVTSNPARYVDHFGARWTLPSDPGSPITKVHYNIVKASGEVVVPEQIVTQVNPTKLDQVSGPTAAGDYRLRVWLEDEVGFSGPVATAPIPHDTTPPAAPQEVSVTNPSTSRSDQGFDVRWRNVTDAGAPIDSARYQVLDGAGDVVVATKELSGANPEAIADLETPRLRGDYTLKVWLADEEGNVGAPAEAPLSYSCGRSEVGGGRSLAIGIGERAERQLTLLQDQGSKVTGTLTGSGGPVSGAALCVFGRVITDGSRDLLGVAMSGQGGGFAFPLAAGPSREISAIYRADQRQIEASATALTQIRPTLKLRRRVVHNMHKAWFSGDIPGPHNDNVVVVLQVKSGNGWRVYRRYRTRSGGHFNVGYRFTQTGSPTTYPIRAQVRRTVGLPYEPGNSPTVQLRVLP